MNVPTPVSDPGGASASPPDGASLLEATMTPHLFGWSVPRAPRSTGVGTATIRAIYTDITMTKHETVSCPCDACAERRAM